MFRLFVTGDVVSFCFLRNVFVHRYFFSVLSLRVFIHGCSLIERLTQFCGINDVSVICLLIFLKISDERGGLSPVA